MGHYQYDCHDRITGLCIWSGHLLGTMMTTRVLLGEPDRQQILACPALFGSSFSPEFQSWPRCTDCLRGDWPCMPVPSGRRCSWGWLGSPFNSLRAHHCGGTPSAISKYTEMLREEVHKHTEMGNCSWKWQSVYVLYGHWFHLTRLFSCLIFFLFPLIWPKQSRKWLYSLKKIANKTN